MKLTLTQDQATAAHKFVNGAPASYRRRGRDYYANGAVQSVACAGPARAYTAEVRGSQLYQVTMDYEDGGWDAECSCPLRFDCKHCIAAMLTLIGSNGDTLPVTGPRTVAAACQEKLGRTPTKAEAALALKLQELYQRTRHYRKIYLSELQRLFPALTGPAWEQWSCWPTAIRDELEWWEYLAVALQDHGVKLPEALAVIVDSDAVRQRRDAWKREQEVARWRNVLHNLHDNHADAPATTTRTVDMRLRLAPDRVDLEWRPAGIGEFKCLKINRFREFAEDYTKGRLELTAESFPIWLPFFQRWSTGNTSSWNTHSPDMKRIVAALLRMPALHERIVNANGTPLVRATEPLRWEVADNANEHGDYRLRLVQADGQPAPAAWWVLDGVPVLHLTADAVYEGPPALPAAAKEKNTDLLVPKPVIETREGLTFLQQIRAPLPSSLRDRVKLVPLRLRFIATLTSELTGNTENVFLRIQAAAPGHLEEFREDNQWHNQRPTTKADDELVVIDRNALAALPGAVQNGDWKWDDANDSWRWRVTKKFPAQFAQWLSCLPGDAELELDKELATLRAAPVEGRVKLDCQPSGVDWFDLAVVLDVADTALTPDELKILLNARGGFVRLGAKGWRRLQLNLTTEDDEQLSRLGLSADDFTGEPQRLHALQLADRAAARFLPEAQVAAIHRRVEELQTRVTPPVPAAISAELRPYQVEGFHFLGYLGANRFGGILADDMGLGKTLQTLTWLTWLREQPGAAGPVLVVCPKSVVDNWRAEVERFAPGLRVTLWKGTDTTALADTPATTDLLVINYTQLRAVAGAVTKIKWLAAILDEGQYIKNPESQTAKAARALQAEHRLVLTGTPIENRLLDLWSLMSFAMPGVLGNRAQFAKRFDQASDPLARRRLAARVRPFLLRRTKSQVAKELPDRIEEDLLCEMEGVQQTLYRAELKRAQQMLLNVQTRAEFDKQRFHFLTSLLRLRQICCHPGLVDAKHVGTESAKLEALTDLIEPLMEEGHKVLVFSQFVTMLDLVEPVLREHDWKFFRLTGATENRGELVKEFQQTKDAAVFLISLKAGGFGLNLTAASYVVLFDPWWNPAVEAQAIDRTHRIGQTRHVNAYRLLIKGSIEEKIRSLQKQKSALAEDILGEERFAQSLTLDDLKFLFAEPA